MVYNNLHTSKNIKCVIRTTHKLEHKNIMQYKNKILIQTSIFLNGIKIFLDKIVYPRIDCTRQAMAKH